jgi:hypothetical protein
MLTVASFGVLDYFFWILLIVAFTAEAWALVDALRRPAAAFVAASKQSKKLWTIILVVATALGMAHAVLPSRGFSPIALLIGILPVAAFIAAAIYLADVRPAVRTYRGGRGGSSAGPYGPW